MRRVPCVRQGHVVEHVAQSGSCVRIGHIINVIKCATCRFDLLAKVELSSAYEKQP